MQITSKFDFNVSHNGWVYSKAEIEKAFEEYKRKVDDGTCLGSVFKQGDVNFPCTLSNASHRVTSASLSDGVVAITAEVLDTPNGKIVKNLINAGKDLKIKPVGYGFARTGCELVMTEISSFDIDISEELWN